MKKFELPNDYKEESLIFPEDQIEHIEEVVIKWNQSIKDYSALALLPNLKKLVINHSNFKNTSLLNGLRKLESLRLFGCNLNDIQFPELKTVWVRRMWLKKEILWPLDPHVNVLIGNNGTGKSTVLNSIYLALHGDYSFNAHSVRFNLNFQTKSFKDDYESVLPSPRSIVKKNDYGSLSHEKEAIKGLITISYSHKHPNDKIFFLENMGITPGAIKCVSKISTFEMESMDGKKAEEQRKNANFPIKTALDAEVDTAINQYKSFQLTLEKEEQQQTAYLDEQINRLVEKPDSATEDLLELKTLLAKKKSLTKDLYQYKNKFEEIVNQLFGGTGKKMEYEANNSIVFREGKMLLTPDMLSSGEKQMLLILLNVVSMNNKYHLLLMDEPELSLHIDWQVDLIGNILALNSQIQLIIVTHSPAIVQKGWRSKVRKAVLNSEDPLGIYYPIHKEA